LINKEYSHRSIAQVMKVNNSTISREIKRNSIAGVYDPYKAQHKSYVKRKYSKNQCMKISTSKFLTYYISICLSLTHSPEQIAGSLKKEKSSITISHATIYKYIHNLVPSLKQYLRYKKKYKKQISLNKESLQDRNSIHNSHRKKLGYETPLEVMTQEGQLKDQ